MGTEDVKMMSGKADEEMVHSTQEKEIKRNLQVHHGSGSLSATTLD